MVEFVKRARKADTDVSERWIWRSLCGRYQVEKHRSFFERNKRGHRLVRYYAVFIGPDSGQTILSNRCQSRERATATCRKHAESQTQQQRV
jgi:hypothetical protein